jgi:hypothetical protein
MSIFSAIVCAGGGLSAAVGSKLSDAVIYARCLAESARTRPWLAPRSSKKGTSIKIRGRDGKPQKVHRRERDS